MFEMRAKVKEAHDDKVKLQSSPFPHAPSCATWAPVMGVYSGKITLVGCLGCNASMNHAIDVPKKYLNMAEWFVMPSAWCREWNFYLQALVDLEKNSKTTDLEYKLQGLEEVVYSQLKPDYDTRIGNVPVSEGSSKSPDFESES